MTQWILIAIAGILNGLQPALNAQLNKSLGQTILAAPVVYLTGLIAIALAAPFVGVRLADYARLQETPWWAFLGGVCGAVFIYAMLSTTAKIGAGAFMAVTVTLGVATSVAIDHFAVLGVDPHPAGIGRLSGVALMFAGVVLIGRY